MKKEVFEEVYKFNGFKDWQHQIIEAGNKFLEKHNVHPQFIRIKEPTLDILLDETEKNYMNPLNSAHSILDSEGEEIVPIRKDISDPDSKYAPAEGFTVGRDVVENEYEEEIDDDVMEFDTDPDTPVSLKSFGFTEDGRISFTTSKYMLYFLDGEDLDDNEFALNYGDDPDSEEEMDIK